MARREAEPGIAGEKARVRQRCLERRRTMSAQALAAASAAIVNRVTAMAAWDASHTVHTYVDAIAGEVHTRELIDIALSAGKCVVVPVVSPRRREQLLHARLDSLELLETGPMGCRQPPVARADFDDLGSIDLVVVPGLAFSPAGVRLGFGGGYYDRFLAAAGATRVGLVCEELLLETIPHADHDMPMDWVVTERALYECAQERQR